MATEETGASAGQLQSVEKPFGESPRKGLVCGQL